MIRLLLKKASYCPRSEEEKVRPRLICGATYIFIICLGLSFIPQKLGLEEGVKIGVGGELWEGRRIGGNFRQNRVEVPQRQHMEIINGRIYSRHRQIPPYQRFFFLLDPPRGSTSSRCTQGLENPWISMSAITSHWGWQAKLI